jgi:endo-1,4-beta-xylanase
VLAACLAVSTCTSFTVWGAGDGLSWVPFFFEGEGAATPWADDFTRKPAYEALWRGLSAAGGSVRQGAE